MSKYTESVVSYLESLADDARDLLVATSDVAEDKVKEARKRLAYALDDGREVCTQLREKAIKGARIADETVRENPYVPIALALIIGGLFVYLFTRRDD